MILTYFKSILDVPPRDVATTFTEDIGLLCVMFMDQPGLVS